MIPMRAAELRQRVADGDWKAALVREFGISRNAQGVGGENEQRIGDASELECLRDENAQLKSKGKGGLALKVSEERWGLSVRHGPLPDAFRCCRKKRLESYIVPVD
jgi:hypothetical protein